MIRAIAGNYALTYGSRVRFVWTAARGGVVSDSNAEPYPLGWPAWSVVDGLWQSRAGHSPVSEASW